MSATSGGAWAAVNGPLAKDVVILRRFDGEEAMSVPFRYRLELISTRALTRDDLLNKPMGFEASPNVPGQTRYVHGLVRSLRNVGRFVGYHVYEVEIVPWLWFLSLNRDCRIFQKKSVKDIVQEVFKESGFTDFRFNTVASYPVRDYTVQFDESDLAFVSRLMEENGLFYYFEHEESKHTLVVADHQGALKKNPLRSEVLYRAPDESRQHDGVIDHHSVEEAVHTGGSILDDYFFEKPTADLRRDAMGDGPGVVYHYPGGYTDGTEGKRLARVRLEADEAEGTRLRGRGNFAGLMPGYRFDLKDTPAADGDYLVVSARIRSGTIPHASFEALDGEDEEPLYDCHFEAIPYATPYRPPWRTPRPRLGIQTAVVVGPKGEEIYTDKFGRVKVRFHWDRGSSGDGESSCWIRVATTWAGNKWGAIQIPRIGQEVVVEFLDGDPDRPLITGSVYNAQQMPPFKASPTQSGWKSHSTKEGTDDSNELRFEDKKGEEEVFVRAEKDLTFEVVNDETITVGHDRTAAVKRNDKLTVDGKQDVTVGGDQTITVTKGDRAIKVDKGKLTTDVEMGDVETTLGKGNMTTTVSKGNVETKVDLGSITYQAMKSIEFKVGSNSIKIDQTGVTIKGMMVKVEAETMAEFKGLTTKVEAQTMTEVKGMMVQVNGSAMLMAKGGMVMIG